mgnify:CR=1 FL=1
MPSASARSIAGRSLRAPNPVRLLCVHEFGERLAFHGTRVLLVIYFTASLADGGREWSLAQATHAYGLFLGLAYLSPFVGGLVGDALRRRSSAVVAGGLMLAAGYALLAIAALTGGALWLALVLVGLGLGLCRANTGALLGLASGADDARRTAGYTRLYVALNAGGALAGFTIGTLGERVAWAAGFGASAAAMLATTLVFVRGRRAVLAADAASADAAAETRHVAPRGWRTALDVQPAALLALTVLAAFAIVFNAAYEQGGGLVAVVTRDQVDREIGGLTVPIAWLQSLPALCLVVFAAPLARLWQALDRRGCEPDVFVKFALALGLGALGLGTLAVGLTLAIAAGLPVALVWVVAFYALLAVADLVMSPVGFAVATRVVPARAAGLATGLWYATWSVGAILGGYLGGLAAAYGPRTVFAALGALLLGASAAMLAIAPVATRWLLAAAPPVVAPVLRRAEGE